MLNGSQMLSNLSLQQDPFLAKISLVLGWTNEPQNSVC